MYLSTAVFKCGLQLSAETAVASLKQIHARAGENVDNGDIDSVTRYAPWHNSLMLAVLLSLRIPVLNQGHVSEWPLVCFCDHNVKLHVTLQYHEVLNLVGS